ncbi:MAG: SpaN/EivJ family type III secretion system needle length determinant [Providencia sp.]|uniref:SpaN/EivJ family type III secretion system needle length determinant n=1 Tax=Providencia sp. TaxID=589 RepID=UPI003F99ACFD
MSVIKTNPSEKIVHRVMEGNATSSKFNSSTFSHKNLIKKIVETAANKKRTESVCHKKQSRKIEDYITPAVAHLPIQVLQNNSMPKAFIALKDSPYTDINTKAVGQSKLLEVDGCELPINQDLPTELKVAHKLVIEDEIPLVNSMIANLVLMDVVPSIKHQPSTHHRTQFEEQTVVLDAGVELNTTKSLAALLPSNPMKLADFPTLESLRGQAKALPSTKKVESKIALQPEIQLEKGMNLSSQMRQMNTNSLNEFKNTTVPLVTDMPLTADLPLKAHELGNKPLGEQGIDVSFSDAQSEQSRALITPQKGTHSSDNSLLEPTGTRINSLVNEEQKSSTLFQEISTEKTDLQNHIVTSVISEMVARPQTSAQAQQPSPMVHKTPESMESNPVFDAKEPKAEARSLTYTFKNWQASPSVTFELASKGEFLGSTYSQEVHQALNENKHLFNHESNVHIRREDERNQQRHDQQQQQQEED